MPTRGTGTYSVDIRWSLVPQVSLNWEVFIMTCLATDGKLQTRFPNLGSEGKAMAKRGGTLQHAGIDASVSLREFGDFGCSILHPRVPWQDFSVQLPPCSMFSLHNLSGFRCIEASYDKAPRHSSSWTLVDIPCRTTKI